MYQVLTTIVLVAAASAQSPGFWEQRPSLNTARQEVACAVLGGKVYCAGGLGANRAAMSTVERFDPNTGRWTFVAPMPTTLHHFGMVALGGKLIVVGGYVSGFTGTDRCYSYDPGTNKWAIVASLPRKRGALVAVAMGGKVYAVGGVVPSVGAVGDLSVYDPATNKWATLTPMTFRREHLSAAAVVGKLYAAGGRRSGSNFKYLEAYDPATNKWARLADMPTARGGNGAATLGGKLIVMGGEFPGIIPQTEEYDPATNKWRSLENMMPGLHGIYPTVLGDEIMVAGGATVAGFAASKTVISLRMLPDGVTAYGVGTATCSGKITAYVTHRPVPGQANFKIVSAAAPPSSFGFLAVAKAADVAGSSVLGFRTHLDLTRPIVLFGLGSNGAGIGTLPVPLPLGTTGLSAFAQFIWANTATCGGAGTASSSHGLSLKIR